MSPELDWSWGHKEVRCLGKDLRHLVAEMVAVVPGALSRVGAGCGAHGFVPWGLALQLSSHSRGDPISFQ
jgi:hypothetical protein